MIVLKSVKFDYKNPSKPEALPQDVIEDLNDEVIVTISPISDEELAAWLGDLEGTTPIA